MRTLPVKFSILLTVAALTSSCFVLDSILATPTPVTALQPPPPSPTIVWFPPSATPTLQVLSTQAATPEMRPGLGDIFLTDKLSSSSPWDTATSDEASAEIVDNRLNVAAQSGVYMVSLRQDLVANDFYAEITARPGLCRGDDTYGFLVRANVVAYYRFSLSCNGTVSAERVSGQKRQILQSAVPSGDAPPGAPGEVRIGVWAVGTEMRLFLNGRYQFSVSDANYASGTMGVFVNAAGNTAATVSFSDLSVQDVINLPPTQAPSP
jgi:hypothetical protein